MLSSSSFYVLWCLLPISHLISIPTPPLAFRLRTSHFLHVPFCPPSLLFSRFHLFMGYRYLVKGNIRQLLVLYLHELEQIDIKKKMLNGNPADILPFSLLLALSWIFPLHTQHLLQDLSTLFRTRMAASYSSAVSCCIELCRIGLHWQLGLKQFLYLKDILT